MNRPTKYHSGTPPHQQPKESPTAASSIPPRSAPQGTVHSIKHHQADLPFRPGPRETFFKVRPGAVLTRQQPPDTFRRHLVLPLTKGEQRRTSEFCVPCSLGGISGYVLTHDLWGVADHALGRRHGELESLTPELIRVFDKFVDPKPCRSPYSGGRLFKVSWTKSGRHEGYAVTLGNRVHEYKKVTVFYILPDSRPEDATSPEYFVVSRDQVDYAPGVFRGPPDLPPQLTVGLLHVVTMDRSRFRIGQTPPSGSYVGDIKQYGQLLEKFMKLILSP